jgi:transcriptional regulator GlxA family with amidase domain
MEANIESPLSVAQIAEQLNQPRRNVERIFRKKTDSSIGQYYMRVRLERAREMLFYSSEAISEISLLCGFSSPAIFTRTFTRGDGTFQIARHLVAERISKLQEITRGSEDRSIYCRNMQIRNPRPEASL